LSAFLNLEFERFLAISMCSW